MRKITATLILVLVLIYSKNGIGQCIPCDAGTTSFPVNFSSTPDTTYSLTSPRSGHCCGATGSTQCIKFEVTVHPQTTEIGFSVANPSPPGGAFYQVNCGPPTSLETPLCVTGMTSFCISFCKSGGDSPTYTISASQSFAASPDVTIHSNCATDISVTGLDEPTITWTSIFPGPTGTYDGYLSCTAACDTTTVTPQAGYPPYIDFLVSGTPVGCAAGVSTDTVRVYITPGIIPTINPNPALVCFGNTNATLTASGTGGAPPFSYLWSTGDTSQSITVGAGTYWVGISDTSAGCPPAYDTVIVTASAGPITANAGIDQTVCSTTSTVTLAGIITEATGGVWTGGGGVFTPNDSTLNATYTPSAAEIAAGTVTLTLSSTGNGGCTPDSDQMTITIQTAPVVNAGVDQSICEGDIVSLSGTVTGGAGTGQWSTSGTGTFAPSNTTLNATYTPSAADITAGTITIILNATASCAPVADTMVITITPQIIVNAGIDQIICSGNVVNLNGSVIGGSTTGQWSTTGSGTFAPSSTALTGTYTPSAADITAGTVTLTLTSTNNGGCAAVNDQMVITIQAAPVVNAGSDQAICEGDIISLSGNVTGGAGTGQWSTWNRDFFSF
jgi:hypothetical protein